MRYRTSGQQSSSANTKDGSALAQKMNPKSVKNYLAKN